MSLWGAAVVRYRKRCNIHLVSSYPRPNLHFWFVPQLGPAHAISGVHVAVAICGGAIEVDLFTYGVAS